MDDSDLWAAYAKGIKRAKTEAQGAEQTPSVQTAKPAPQPQPRKGPSVSLDTMPLAWRKQIEGEPVAVTPEPEPLPAEEKPAAAPVATTVLREALDPRIEKNMSLGEIVIEARLDLHGKTEQEAHEALIVFIEAQHKRGRRMVLVITGKGKDGLSALRQNLPRWCDVSPLADSILAVRTAAITHGGEGAYYILLRKRNR